ncbi:hypothetical protein CCPUN_00540 [Cardinium endosymbiont of Culicoides punctatus]|nr:hypothetical protein CCPUN_00540 [Cardinium endosymbiont of Culicoides punctatus]
MKGLQNFNPLQGQEMEWVVGGGASCSREKTELEKFDAREFERKRVFGPPLTKAGHALEAERVAERERLRNRLDVEEGNKWLRQVAPECRVYYTD